MNSEQQTEKATFDTDAVIDEISRFVAEQTGTRPEADQDLFATGVANSMFAMQLVVFLEQAYSVTVAGPDLQLFNFLTVKSMAALTARLRAESAAGCDV
ncbi:MULTISPECIES: acyl carrier protein [unclassified Amycolatopsis]|uniref:acyl carrier protein n=1 Tax=unclassified Amycolatopsis TaxID=2618356 RepID=UPI001FF69AE5|nr:MULTISPECIES: acyl carrier protein [unclassified Amycolatopsis]UOZ04971.1 acyl carrier protein [Amycolatopsis sp. WQ 127309]WSJ80492.1 acyl carrier protein [Amycolatopsis sp. NBC_01307]WSK76027.1 acyl carrier protein [Amycolatopsis sp. NBC_01286]